MLVYNTKEVPDLERLKNSIGFWGNNASCVAIGPNWVVSCKHQDNFNDNVNGRKIVIGDVATEVVASFNFNDRRGPNIPEHFHRFSVDDFILAKTKDPLPSFLPIYLGELPRDAAEVVLAGCGRTAGPDLTISNKREFAAGFAQLSSWPIDNYLIRTIFNDEYPVAGTMFDSGGAMLYQGMLIGTMYSSDSAGSVRVGNMTNCRNYTRLHYDEIVKIMRSN